MAIPTSPQFMLHDIFTIQAYLLLQTASSRIYLVSQGCGRVSQRDAREKAQFEELHCILLIEATPKNSHWSRCQIYQRSPQPGTCARSDQPYLCSGSKPHTLRNCRYTEKVRSLFFFLFVMIRQAHDVNFFSVFSFFAQYANARAQ